MSEPIATPTDVGTVQSVGFTAPVTGPEAPAAPASDAGARPDWLPEEFATIEQFTASYAELKSAAGAPADGEDGAASDDGEAPESHGDMAAQFTQDAGLDYDAVTEHFAENGTLAEEHYTAFEAAGLPRELVDGYLAGQSALLNQFKSTVLSASGGEEAWQAASAWAGAGNFTEAELGAYNAAVNSGDVAQAQLAVQGLIARHQARTGSEPNLADGQGGAAAVPGYESRAQMIADMQNPLYAKDPAFRAKVERKVQLSNLF